MTKTKLLKKALRGFASYLKSKDVDLLVASKYLVELRGWYNAPEIQDASNPPDEPPPPPGTNNG